MEGLERLDTYRDQTLPSTLALDLDEPTIEINIGEFQSQEFFLAQHAISEKQDHEKVSVPLKRLAVQGGNDLLDVIGGDNGLDAFCCA